MLTLKEPSSSRHRSRLQMESERGRISAQKIARVITVSLLGQNLSARQHIRCCACPTACRKQGVPAEDEENIRQLWSTYSMTFWPLDMSKENVQTLSCAAMCLQEVTQGSGTFDGNQAWRQNTKERNWKNLWLHQVKHKLLNYNQPWVLQKSLQETPTH